MGGNRPRDSSLEWGAPLGSNDDYGTSYCNIRTSRGTNLRQPTRTGYWGRVRESKAGCGHPITFDSSTMTTRGSVTARIRGSPRGRYSNYSDPFIQDDINATNGGNFPTRDPHRGRLDSRGGSYFQDDTNFGNEPKQPTPAEHSRPDEATLLTWREWPELTIQLRGLPADLGGTRSVYQACQIWGSVERIDFDRKAPSCARVIFAPAPEKAFWETGCFTIINPLGQKIPVGVSLLPPKRVRIREQRKNGELILQSWEMAASHYKNLPIHPIEMGFGQMVGERSMVVKHRVNAIDTNNHDERLAIDLNFSRRKILVRFATNYSETPAKCFNFSIRFSDLRKVHYVKVPHINSNKEAWALIIYCLYPPYYSTKETGSVDATFSGRESWNRSMLWYRVTNIISDNGRDRLKNEPVALCNDRDDTEFIDIGRCTAFRFVFATLTEMQDLLGGLVEFGVMIDDGNFHVIDAVGRKTFWSTINQASPEDHPSSRLLSGDEKDSLIYWASNMPFELRYPLEVCISQGLLVEHNLTPKFFQTLQEMDLNRGRLALEYVADQRKRIWDPMAIFDDEEACQYSPQAVVQRQYYLTRRVTVTPTTVIMGQPAPEVTNRVLRNFQAIQGRFIRVQFTAEVPEGRINSSAETEANDDLYKRVYRTLHAGIRIGNRLYEFLAFGNSQIRECGAYFFCPAGQDTCHSIRASLGSFGHIRIVAKYAARIGQCFSTTTPFRGISKPNRIMIEDIKNNGYCFTDGVGKISRFLAELVVNDLGLDIDFPSAFQIRLGGCKGVLAVWPDAKKSNVYIRESQLKFQSDSAGLEIIRPARFASATLNRQIIIILETLGVPAEAFMKLLNMHIGRHESAQRSSVDAIDLLKSQVDENHTTQTLAKIVRHGFIEEEVQEPFVKLIMDLWRVWSFRLVKEKARIPIDKSAFVLGCVDETGKLRGHSKATEGSQATEIDKLPQIFLQISNSEEGGNSRIISGVCIVGRNPSLHPGDIRVVEAVDSEDLHHLRDVVVFPSVGDRDLPSMLSGGDLDGDDFFVIWEPSLIPPEWNHPPMSYTPLPPLQLDRPVEERDLREFFVRHMKNDVLPAIALNHLATADSVYEGAKHPNCLTLAALHSKAVDYAKTGEPAELPRNLRLRKWPHFMRQRAGDDVYHSTKANGQIYDRVHQQQFKPGYTHKFDARVLNACPADETMLGKAKAIKHDYDIAIRRLMNKREISTEFEIWSGFPMSRPRVGSGYKLQEDLGREFCAIKQRFMALCYDAAGGHSAEFIEPFVAAMYTVTENEIKSAIPAKGGTMSPYPITVETRPAEAKPMPLMSFPWIFPKIMCDIVRKAPRNPRNIRQVAETIGTAPEELQASNFLTPQRVPPHQQLEEFPAKLEDCLSLKVEECFPIKPTETVVPITLPPPEVRIKATIEDLVAKAHQPMERDHVAVTSMANPANFSTQTANETPLETLPSMATAPKDENVLVDGENNTNPLMELSVMVRERSVSSDVCIPFPASHETTEYDILEYDPNSSVKAVVDSESGPELSRGSANEEFISINKTTDLLGAEVMVTARASSHISDLIGIDFSAGHSGLSAAVQASEKSVLTHEPDQPNGDLIDLSSWN